jgi:hypothetical protein
VLPSDNETLPFNYQVGRLWDDQVKTSTLADFNDKLAVLKANFKEGNDLQMTIDVYHIRENLDRIVLSGQQNLGQSPKFCLDITRLILSKILTIRQRAIQDPREIGTLRTPRKGC